MLCPRVTHSVFHVTVHLGHLCPSGHPGLPGLLHEPGIPWAPFSLCPAEFFFWGTLTSKAVAGTHGHWVFQWLSSEAQISWAGDLTLCLGLLI